MVGRCGDLSIDDETRRPCDDGIMRDDATMGRREDEKMKRDDEGNDGAMGQR